LQSVLLPATIALFIIAGLSLQAASDAQQPDLSFQNESSFIDENKLLHVLGEIRNESSSPMKDVLITATFFDKERNSLGQFQRSSELRVINPSEISPFEILFLDQKNADRVVNYTLSATGTAAPEPKAKQIRILSSNSRLDVLGTYYINALARNEGQQLATNAIMIATLYDSDGRVVAIGKALAEATPGSSDIPAGSEAPFGIPVTEKLQTYKTARYSLIVDSDQYVSDTVILQPTTPGATSRSSGNQTSGCLIATAAFGSELAPQVQQLRLFRDEVAMQTLSGRSFMNVFNSWYYSFSPSIAEYERNSPWLTDAVRISVYPLLAILDVSTKIYGLVAPEGVNQELAMVAAGISASSLVGAVYLGPAAVFCGLVRRASRPRPHLMYAVICVWLGSLGVVQGAAMISLPTLMMFGSVALVLSTIATVVMAIATKASRL
jgi:peptide/nickel transport system substrate-binding protein